MVNKMRHFNPIPLENPRFQSENYASNKGKMPRGTKLAPIRGEEDERFNSYVLELLHSSSWAASN